jgi:hypothetical protein
MAAVMINVTFIEAARVPDPVEAGFSPWQVIWHADSDQMTAAAVIERNTRVGKALAEIFPGVAEIPRGHLDPEELALFSDDNLPPEAMIQRLARRRAWTIKSDGPVSDVSLTIFDGMANVDLRITDPSSERRAEIAALIDQVADILRREASMALWDYGTVKIAPEAPGALVMSQSRTALDRQAKANRIAAFERRAGPVVAAILTLMLLAAVAFTLFTALESGLASTALRDQPALTFVTLEAPQDGSFRLWPSYILLGTVNGEPARLSVGRPEYLRAAVGARFSVLATGDRDHPYILLSQAGNQVPALPLGNGRALPLHLALVLAGLTALWVLFVLRPLLTRPPQFDRITRSGVAVAKLGGVAGVFMLVGVFLQRFSV